MVSGHHGERAVSHCHPSGHQPGTNRVRRGRGGETVWLETRVVEVLTEVPSDSGSEPPFLKTRPGHFGLASGCHFHLCRGAAGPLGTRPRHWGSPPLTSPLGRRHRRREQGPGGCAHTCCPPASALRGGRAPSADAARWAPQGHGLPLATRWDAACPSPGRTVRGLLGWPS